MTELLSRPAPKPSAPTPLPERSRSTFRPDIQGMRAVAVLLVVLYHAGLPGLTGGYVGVDVFFVISGFLITGQLVRELGRSGRVDLLGFYARRMRRLLPAALLVVLVTVVVARLYGPLLQVKSTALDALWSALYAINFRLAAEGVNYQRANATPSPVQHMWSLAVEEQFYLVWPLLALVAVLLVRRRARLIRPTLVVVVVAGTVVSLWASHVVTTESAPTAYFSVQTRAWEFGFGALVALGSPLLAHLPRALCLPASWVGLGVVVGSAWWYDDATPFPGTAAVVPVAGIALLIACGTRGGGVDRRGAARPLGVRPMQWIGMWSYSWYLWHWPALVLAPALLGHPLSWQDNLQVMVLALWVAALTYALVERPTRRGDLRRKTWVTRGLAISGVAASACLVTIASAPSIVGDGRYAPALTLSSPSTRILESALASAVKVDRIPGNLTPTLQGAADDVPVTHTGCHLDFLQVVEQPCVFGDVHSSRTVVIFGDSHAQQWDGAFVAAAQQQHWRVVSWTKAACPVADLQLINPELKRPYTECDQWRSSTIGRIQAMHPDLVIASQSDSVPGHGVTSNQWAIKTVSTLRSLQGHGIGRLVFLADTPYPREDVPSCLAAHLNHPDACTVTRAGAYNLSDYYAERHTTVVDTVRSAGITVVDPIDWLCSALTCPVIVQDTLVYRDESHMTDTYSRALAPIVAPLLTKGSS